MYEILKSYYDFGHRIFFLNRLKGFKTEPDYRTPAGIVRFDHYICAYPIIFKIRIL